MKIFKKIFDVFASIIRGIASGLVKLGCFTAVWSFVKTIIIIILLCILAGK